MDTLHWEHGVLATGPQGKSLTDKTFKNSSLLLYPSAGPSVPLAETFSLLGCPRTRL